MRAEPVVSRSSVFYLELSVTERLQFLVLLCERFLEQRR